MLERTLAQWAKHALDCQTAVNSSGVANELTAWLCSVACKQACSGTHEKNTHPITRLFVSKLTELANMFVDDVTYAWDWCKKEANKCT